MVSFPDTKTGLMTNLEAFHQRSPAISGINCKIATMNSNDWLMKKS